MIFVMRYFGIPAAQFRKEYAELSLQAKEQLKDGIENGTLTY